jgi:tRNA-specific 2-thiouridylase
MARIAVAMSGGVDSSTAAALLREEGHEVVGLTLQLWDHSEVNLAAGKGRCCSPADIADARAVSAHLDIPHYVFDHTNGFSSLIVDPFVQAYSEGLTPSPCIRCNRLVKFDLLGKLARGLDAEMLATGHYARLALEGERPQLSKAKDRKKDQSYFLFDVPVPQLSNVCFPLGNLAKDEVRTAADRFGLSVARKSESYELCFIPDGDKDTFLEGRMKGSLHERRGSVRSVAGELLGSHDGLHRFTIGQRRGLGISSSEPLYVIDLDATSRTVTVGPAEYLESRGLIAADCNWISIPAPEEPLALAARIRHRHEETPATLTPAGKGRFEVRFDVGERAVTPGQGVAFYDGDLLLGGGWIEKSLVEE